MSSEKKNSNDLPDLDELLRFDEDTEESDTPDAGDEKVSSRDEVEELRAQLAAARAELMASNAPDVQEPDEPAEDSILIHFVADGFLAFGQAWYRGQEVEIEIDSPQYKLTLNSRGESWLDRDANTQFDTYGEEKFRKGPWTGKKWGDTSTLTTPEEIADMERAAQAEARRRRKAPALSTF